QAAAIPARSLSVKLATTMSAAPWPRSTGWAISSSVAEEVARMCMSGLESGLYGRAVDALFADDHKTARARLADTPGAIEIVVHARAHGLDKQTHRPALDREETLHAQDVVVARVGCD